MSEDQTENQRPTRTVLVPVGLGALFGVLAVLAFRHELERLVSRQRFDDVSSWVRRVVREEPSGDTPF